MLDDLIKFVNAHPFLCLGTLGFSILGYLGYRSVIWIIDRCEKIMKVEAVGPVLKNQPPPKINQPLPEMPLTKTKHEVCEGYGQYVVFKIENGAHLPISYDLFEKVYQVFQRYSPGAIAAQFKNKPKEGAKVYENRFELLRKEIKLIDTNFEIAFIPKVLYELNFLHQTIKENLDTNAADLKKRRWHLPRFADNGAPNTLHQKDVTELAYRLNEVIVNKLPPRLNLQHIHAMAEQELCFFRDHSKSKLNINLETHLNPTLYFSASAEKFKNCANVKSMGISTEIHANVIRKAIDLECSPLAKSSIFLYRGSDFDKDSPINADGGDPFALSYGTSLFAGAVYDPGAAAFTYMRNEKDAFAHAIPFEMIETSPFRFPGGDVLRQLHGHGEKFHARSKLWEIGYHTPLEWNLWKSDLSKQSFLNLYQEIKSQSIMLR